ncbi:hypothetical protein EKL32_27650, partial [Flavobacterium sp. GSN2]
MTKIYFLFVFFISSLVFSQNAADIEHAFNDLMPLNYYNYSKQGKNSSRPIAKIQPDGKIIINSGFGLERIDNNIKDLSFNVGLGFSLYTLDYSIDIFEIQPSGKIVVSGTFNSYNGTQVNKLIRLNTNGDLDTTFNCPGVTVTRSVSFQSDGKIVVCGILNGVSSLFRLNDDGSIDSSFNISDLNGQIKCLSNGKILAIDNYNKRVKRFNSEGSLDLTFISPSVWFALNDYIMSFAIQSDGKILLGGEFTTYNGLPVNDLIRLNADGSFDSSFSTDGYVFSKIQSIVVDSTGEIFISSDFAMSNGNYNSNNYVLKLNGNGSIDTSFNFTTGSAMCGTQQIYYGLTIQNDDKILIQRAGYCSGFGFKFDGVGRLNNDGTIDNTFNSFAGFNAKVKVIVLQPDNKILVGGEFTAYKGEPSNFIVRLNPDYSKDMTFNVGAGFNNTVNAIVIQPNGAILVGGDFYMFNNVIAQKIIRLNIDGSMDNTFNIINKGFEGTGGVRAIKLQPDSKIIVAGAFTGYYDNLGGRSLAMGIVRLNANASVDTSFNTGANGFYPGVANSIVLQSSGKIIVGGSFYQYSYGGNYPQSVDNLARLNSNGTLDSFRSSYIDPINVLIEEQSGKILAGTTTGIKRIELNGSSTYVNPFQVVGGVSSIVIQPDNKILIGGNFTKIGDQLHTRFARLNVTGSVDMNFNSYGAVDASVLAIALQSTGKIFIGGNFNSYKQTLSSKIITLKGDDFYGVSGNNKLDLNIDGCDINDLIFPFLKLEIDGFTLIPNNLGSYSFSIGAGTHMIVPVLENPAYFNVSPSTVNVTFPAQANPFIQNFCVTASGMHPDLEVSIIPVAPARPGFDAKYKIIYKNKGNNIQSGTVNLNFNDSVLDFVSANPITSNQTTNNLSWDFVNFKPFETREIMLTLNVNSPTETPPVNNGYVLNYTATVSGATDDTPIDNTLVFNQTALNSFDPNDKTCLEGATISPAKVGDYVHYMIRFENTGTFPAQNIVVKDMIDLTKFDINTLFPIKGSHSFVTNITSGNKVEFIFENINLPFDDANNDGYVAFKIKTKPTLVLGNTFSNTASIYFDYNFPIVTNTATTTIAV